MKRLFLLFIILFIYRNVWADSITIYIEDINCNPGINLQVPVEIQDVTGENIYSYYFEFSYDSNLLCKTGFNSDNTLSKNGITLEAATNFEDKIGIIWYDSAPLAGAGTLINLNFDVLGSPGDSALFYFDNFFFNEGFPKPDYLSPLGALNISFDGSPYDLNYNMIIDIFDLQILSSFHGQASEAHDFDNSGIVDTHDLMLMMRQIKYNY